MNPHVQRKQRWVELEELAKAHFISLLSNEQIPEDEAQRVISGVLIGLQRPRKTLTLKVSLLPPRKQEIELTASGYPIDNHWDTKVLCLLEVDAETAQISVTIVNEMPWLRQDMLM
ncbi:hypothetical protein [Undibacterium sp. TC9W]|uniref:hypothetical protein n=1 Tax=Undibacterium sp. TC9W TaxID=3413053 RepID=UPI003BEFF349